jgi:hypothetical protein
MNLTIPICHWCDRPATRLINGDRYCGTCTISADAIADWQAAATTKIAATKIARLLDSLASAQHAADNYRRMLALATELGMEYEIDRMRENAFEYDEAADDLMCDLLGLGYDPDSEQ